MRRRWGARRLLLVAEAVAALCMAKLTMTSIPFRLTSRLLGAAAGGAAGPPGAGDERAADIGWAVAAAARRLPWESSCLVQAAATAAISACHGVDYTLWLGVNRSPDAFLAHAWVTSGARVVVGGRGHREFTPVASFSRPGRTLSGGPA